MLTVFWRVAIWVYSTEEKPIRSSREIPEVLLYGRRPYRHGNFSIESVFEDVRQRLSSRLRIESVKAPVFSNSILNRLIIILHAAFVSARMVHITGDIAFAATLIRKSRLIVSIMDCVFLHQSKGFKRQLLKYFYLTLPCRRASVVTTISQFSKSEILNHLAPRKIEIEVVYPSISDSFKFTPKEWEGSFPTILFLGTTPNKNLTRVIEALAGIDCMLEIIGVIPADQLQLLSERRIRYRNFARLEQSEIVAAYVRSDLLLFPSTYEGFGMPIVEAQRIGRPVVTSKIGATAEVAGDGAILVNPFDVPDIRRGVCSVMNDPILRQQLVRSGLENAKRFDGAESAEQFFAIYQRLLSVGRT